MIVDMLPCTTIFSTSHKEEMRYLVGSRDEGQPPAMAALGIVLVDIKYLGRHEHIRF